MRTPRAPRRETLQRGIIILPSAFTLGNLFFGLYAIVAATRGDLVWAGWFIMFAGTLDMLDGSVARLTRTGSRFGAELDSLVDAISFGVAPGMIAYELFFFDAQWAWTLSFVWVTAVVVRLARFNIEQGGEAKRSFHGLPSPAAGMALASYYPFSQTPFFETYLFDLPWAQIIGISMVLLSVLMVSHVPYAKVPKIGLRTVKGVTTTVFVLTTVFAAFAFPRYVIFSSFLIYISWGLVKSVLLGLLDRLPGGDPLLDEDEHDMDDRAEVRELAYADFDSAPSDISRSNSILNNDLEDQA
ncbi:MAG: CDP-diacylglycerol--serine O-phosphatidyltransferase [Gemmatimonadales bacterium]|jgi:CDP-diacylglycerol--serine O-phosphatidyltransferase|nr:CDP-diacylglycerol--serine O-phosphatidyltransferase [Gemmatimonadales bacterium]MDG2238914.1 CDP-diacylglycerol--serine O-phosphatidyltransferase [Longimicrobiales bacterium]NCG34324.1 CDP-diacylglycerol--serine O-phosphatidyltransferase [Pseudomonadota bacterium]MBT3499060.1 CDP-diacylglycerol--serine O-phosphatidyltransferase [Gemmatimonadales bacterium]MBT3774204.1 CDP-diacylglycerol--serine O-phosphatidyltransferase [Gemmatimonadales bacterium]